MPTRVIVDLAGTGQSTFKVGAAFAVKDTRQITGAVGDLVGGGALNADLTFSLATTGVGAGSYGDASHVGAFTVDAKGRLTAATSVLITPAGIGAAATAHTQAWSTLTSTPTTLAGYGIADAVSSSDARLTDSRTPTGSAGGDLTGSYPNPSLGSSGVAAGTYGGVSLIPVIVVDAKGRITSVSTVAPVSVPSGTVGGDLTGSLPNPTIAPGVVTNAKLVNSSIFLSYANGITGGASVALGATLSLGLTFGSALNTVCQGNDSRLSDSRAPTGAAGGSLTGTYPNPTIASLAIVDGMVSASAAIAWSKISKVGALPADIGAASASATWAWSSITSTPTTLAGYGITNGVANTVTVTGTNSVSGGGDLSTNRTFQLSGDVASPGNTYYYGTNGSGTKGWYALPGATVYAPAADQYVVIGSTSGIGLANARQLAANSGILLTDGGAGAAATLTPVYGTTLNTVCQGNDSRLSDSRTPSGSAGGDLSGAYPSPTISASAIVTRFNSLTTADLLVTALRVVDSTDASKKIAFVASSIATATTRSITVPNANLTLAGINIAQTFSALQTLSAGLTISAGAVTLPAASVAVAAINATGTPSSLTYLRGDGSWATISAGTSMLDGSFAIKNTADNSKQFKWSLTAHTTGVVLTLASAQTTSQTLNVPNIATSDTLMTLGLAQTVSGAKTFSALMSLSAGLTVTAGSVTLPAASVGIATINATGTPSSTTYLRGDGTWTTPSGSGLTNIASSVTGGTLTLGGSLTTGRTATFPDASGTVALLNQTQTFTGGMTLTTAGLTLTAVNLSTDTTTGCKIGTATTQKIAFYNATPIVQPTGDVATALVNLGLIASPTIAVTTALDGSFAVKNTADNTKQLAFALSGMTTAKVLTIASAQTTTQTLTIPNITAGDTLMTLAIPGVVTGAMSITNAAGLVTPVVSSTSSLVLKSNGTTAAITISTAQDCTFAGEILTIASAAGRAGLNVPHGAAPTSPVNGDIWTTTAGLYAQINGATVGPFGAGGTPAGSTKQIQYNAAGSFGAGADFMWDFTNKWLYVYGLSTPTGLGSSTVIIGESSVVTLAANLTDTYGGGLSIGGVSVTGAFTITRHNYIQIPQFGLAGGAALTDACVLNFPVAAGTHKAVDGATTKTSPGTVSAWVKINIAGTVYYMPAYTSKTA